MKTIHVLGNKRPTQTHMSNPITSKEETCIQYLLEILKRSLKNSEKICFVVSVCIAMYVTCLFYHSIVFVMIKRLKSKKNNLY